MAERRAIAPSTRGLALPMRADDRGALAMSTGLANIEQSMRAVLATVPGERVMRPDFGCDIWRMMADPMDASGVGQAEASVRDAIVAWERRVDVADVAVRPVEWDGDAALVAPESGDHVEGTCVDVDIGFTERATASRAIAQFRLVLTSEPAIVVHLGGARRDEWTSRPLLQRARGAR